MSLVVHTQSPEETEGVGRRLGELAQGGEVFLVVGGLGAGKTVLAQGIARGLGIAEYVLSPSFVLMRVYQGRLPLYHIDLYRMGSIPEVAELGLEEYLYGPGVAVIEWAERGWGVWPREHLLIEMAFLTESRRRLRLLAHGERYQSLVEGLRGGG